MYGGCALSMEQSEVPPKAADSRYGVAPTPWDLRALGRRVPWNLGRCDISRPPDALAPRGGGWRREYCGRWRRGCGHSGGGCCGRVVQWGAAVPLAPSCASVLWAAGARSVWRCAGWQDSRVVRDLRGPCSEKGPFLARSSRYAFPKGDLRGFSDTWRANLAKASSFRMHGGDMLP